VRRYPFLFRFFLTYLVILVLPFLLAVYTYLRTAEVYYRDVQRMNQVSLQQTSRLVEEKIAAIDTLVERIALDPRLNRLLSVRTAPHDPDYPSIVEVWESLRYLQLPELTTTYFVYASAGEIVFTPTTVYLSTALFYRHYFDDSREDEPGFDLVRFDQWRGALLTGFYQRQTKSNVPVSVSSQPRPAILYMQSLPISAARGTTAGTVIVVIDSESVAAMIREAQSFDTFDFSIRSASNETIFAMVSRGDAYSAGASTQEILESPRDVSSITTTHIGNNGWTYTVAVPQSVVFATMSYFRRTIYWYGLAVLALALGLAFAFSRRSSRPISEVLSSLPLRGAAVRHGRDRPRWIGNPVELLTDRLKATIADNAALEARIENQDELLGNAFLHRLLNGEISREAEAVTGLRRMGVTMTESGVCVIVVRATPDAIDEVGESAERQRFIVFGRAMLETAVADHGVCYHQEPDMLGAIVPAEQTAAAGLQGILDRIVSVFESAFPGGFVVGVGTTISDVRDIHRSYREACECAAYAGEFGIGRETRVARYSEIREAMEAYSYPVELEGKLGNLVRAGRRDAVRSVFSEIRRANFIERNLGLQMIAQLMNEITGTLVKIISKLRFADAWPEHSDLDPFALRGSRDSRAQLESEVDRLEEAFLDVCDVVRDAQGAHNTVLAKRLAGEIADRYQDPDLSLETLGETLKVSPSYLSHLFKQHTGENFYSHVEQVRIDEAKRLLLETTLSVGEVAARVGYRTDQAFRRAFKRVTGLRPTLLRNSPPG
jgi:two-component system, response regulator YesN